MNLSNVCFAVLFHVERCFKIKETAKHTFDSLLTIMNLSNVCFAVLFHGERCFKTKQTAKHTFDRFFTIMNLSNVLKILTIYFVKTIGNSQLNGKNIFIFFLGLKQRYLKLFMKLDFKNNLTLRTKMLCCSSRDSKVTSCQILMSPFSLVKQTFRLHL